MTLPALAPTVPPAYSSLYEETKAQWNSEEDNEAVEAVRENNQSFNAKLYDVVTDDLESENVEEVVEEVEDEDAAYHNRLDELQKKYGSKPMSEVDAEDFRFSATNRHPKNAKNIKFLSLKNFTIFRFSATHEHPTSHLHGQGKMEDPLIMLMKVNFAFEDLAVLISTFSEYEDQ